MPIPTKPMPRREWEKLMAETIQGHVQELRELVAENEITEEDHDRIGLLFQQNVAHLISLSDTAWKTFKRMVNESRDVQQTPHEPHPDDLKQPEGFKTGGL